VEDAVGVELGVVGVVELFEDELGDVEVLPGAGEAVGLGEAVGTKLVTGVGVLGLEEAGVKGLFSCLVSCG
jgi:hypothetical protein